MSNILLALVYVDAAVGLARQHMAVQVIVTLVTIVIKSVDDKITSSCRDIVDKPR